MDFYFIVGVILYFAIVLDILQTTLSMQGGGWITSKFSHHFWKFFLAISGRNGKSKVLAHTGYFLLIFIVLIWVLILWASLILILSAYPGSILDSTTQMPTNIWQKVYYSGFTISTLGMGDFVPSTNVWRIITSIYSFTGLILLTMSVTYFIPVLSAVIDQRKLGIKLSTLGSSPEEIVINGWNGKDFNCLLRKIDNISDLIIKYSQQHRAYPVIHYFHNVKEKNAIILQLAKLYEALSILSVHVKEEIRPEENDLKPLVIAFENYFEVLAEVTHISTGKSVPPLPGRNKLIEKQLVLDLQNYDFSEDVNLNRKIFKTLVHQDGWDWKQVVT
ncbi:potassium channel family protein [Gramella sp. GC03-9]|uniref:Potassium channel family protein n=1 Tax=Christiangramia oceanisediminis TaxID=2920386 RepID=A0A9X2RAH7_9FLAO|nr:potassium channel family protein [Gramella oceanisediminis]MCP9200544.1 potassium channel family protein [Gramella oceanisediminis]